MGFWGDLGKGLVNHMQNDLEERKKYLAEGRSMDDEKLLKALRNSSGKRKSSYKMVAEERGLI